MSIVLDDVDRARSRLPYKRYWLALYRHDVDAAAAIVEQCLERFRPEQIYLRLFEPALNLSGTLFAMGRISYHDEHRVTHHTMRLIRRVRREFVPKQTTGPLAIAAGVAQESHLVGLRMVCDFLMRDNWRIHWLKSNDRATFGEACAKLQPAAMLLSIGLEDGIPIARRLIGALRHHMGCDTTIVVGGGAINRRPEVVQEIGADFTARNGLELARVMRRRGLTRIGASV